VCVSGTDCAAAERDVDAAAMAWGLSRPVQRAIAVASSAVLTAPALRLRRRRLEDEASAGRAGGERKRLLRSPRPRRRMGGCERALGGLDARTLER
jgi:hypothetical protein